MMVSRIPLIVTIDVEFAPDHNHEQQSEILERIVADLERLQMTATFFVTANVVARFASQLVSIVAKGHEIGCHGLAHSPDENYQRLDREVAMSLIREAGEILHDSIGEHPRAFRGPSMCTSASTQRALVDLGYESDFSVCSQRLDLFNTLGGSAGWLTAPRTPYRPSATSPFRKGDVDLAVVPLSCIGLPYLSGTLYTLGLSFMKGMFAALKFEALVSEKPIVYLFHSYEFCEPAQDLREGVVKQKLLHRMYEQDRARRYKYNLELLKYMASHPEMVAVTASQYVRSAMLKRQ